MRTPSQIKQQIKEAFEHVESGEFLRRKTHEEMLKRRREFHAYKAHHPTITLEDWKASLESSIDVNVTDPQVMQAIGIYLLGLDQLTDEEISPNKQIH